MKKTVIILGALSLFACKKETTPTGTTDASYTSGVFISNEGVWGSGIGTLSHYNDANKSTVQTAFADANGYNLGDVFQSTTIHENNAYMVINNSGLIEVANATSLKSKGQISGFSSPRYMIGVTATLGYVTDWNDNNVKIIDLTTNTIIASIAVGVGPENLLLHNGMVYVANSGGFNLAPDSTISVIDIATHKEVNKITVGDSPQSLQIDDNGDLWVLCQGVNDWQNTANNTAGKLVKVPLSGSLPPLVEYDFVSTTLHPGRLEINGAGNTLYYLSDLFAGKLFAMPTNAISLPTVPFVDRTFYSIGVNPNNEDVYGTDALFFNQIGWVYRYDLNGSILDSFQTGVGPADFTFID